jgi:uncharacterized protein (TIGR02145 family)
MKSVLFFVGYTLLIMLFGIGCKEVTEYKEKNTINFEQFDSLKKQSQIAKGITILDSVFDIELNSYPIVKIGKQIWFAQNLRTTKYNDGQKIDEISDNDTWSKINKGATTTYPNLNDTDSLKIYGKLYNWKAVETKKLCPKGWHVPSISEWDTLELFLSKNLYAYEDGNFEIAQSLVSTNGWCTAENLASPGFVNGIKNTSGFNAFPAGSRSASGSFYYIWQSANFWTSTEYDKDEAHFRQLFYFTTKLAKNRNPKNLGMSIRCVKD